MTGFLSKYIAVGVSSLAVTLIAVPVLMRLALRLKLVDNPGGRRTHAVSTPLCGGVAIFLATHLAVAIVFIFHWDKYSGNVDLNVWLELVLMSFLVLALGVYDDRFRLSPRWKLLGQIVVASLVFALGTNFGKMLYIPFPPFLSYVATVLWLVGAMNAFNLIDGMDGLATGLGLIGAMGLGLVAIFTGNLSDALLMVSLAASCIGFLIYNFYPARAFLGDAGSMLIGFTLAWFALRTSTKAPTLMALSVPILAMGIPLLDTFLALWRRFVRHLLDGTSGRGSGLFTADREHLHDRLRYAGFSQRRAAGVLYGLAAFLMVAGLLATFFSSHRAGILMATFAAFSYVIIRHLAKIELWDSGRLAVRGLEKPTPVVLAVILYPLIDILVLSISLWIVIVLLGPQLSEDCTKNVWLNFAPMGVGIPFLAIVFSRTYRRVWSRARISEYGYLMFWLVGGIAVGAATLQLFYGISPREMLLVASLYLGSSFPGIFLVRAFPRLLQDTMSILQRRQDLDAGGWTLLYGAGHTATLFIRQDVHRKAHLERMKILGFLDDDRNLFGRIICSYPVLGQLEDIPTIAAKYPVARVIITHDVPTAKRDHILELAKTFEFEVQCWQPELKTCYIPSAVTHDGHST